MEGKGRPSVSTRNDTSMIGNEVDADYKGYVQGNPDASLNGVVDIEICKDLASHNAGTYQTHPLKVRYINVL